jgi:hypothetical protein
LETTVMLDADIASAPNSGGRIRPRLAVVYVPVLQNIFGTTALPVSDLLIALGAGVAVLVLVELWK